MKLPVKLSSLALIIAFFFVVWIDLPDGMPIKINAGPIHIDRVVVGPQVSFDVLGRTIEKRFETKLGLDLKGGSHLLFEADVSKVPSSEKDQALESARNIIERRVNFFGVSEPQVQTVTSGGVHRISVDLPGVENVEQAIALIGQTAQLEFKEEGAVEVPVGTSPEEAMKIATQSSALFRLTKSTGLSGKHVKRAFVQFGQGSGTDVGNPSVALEFDADGTKMFEEVTGRNIGKPLGIFIDNQLLSAPTVQQKISGQAIITGNFTVDEAENLANAINSGALPVPIKMIEQRNIGPTLGQEAIQRSIFAGVIGLLTVVLFMVLYYGRFGMVAAVGLLIYGLISYAIFRAIPVVLTLPGVAGFILSIGMAVDANILIFERIKEERRKGRSYETALNLGFGHAIDAIKDANIATLLVAFILFNPLNWSFFPQFGLIKGFALTLAIGVATSLFTGVFITKKLLKLKFVQNMMSNKKLAEKKS